MIALTACACISGAAHAQQGSSIAAPPDLTQGMPTAQGLPNMSAMPDSPGASGGRLRGTGPLGDDAPRYQRPVVDDKHFAWGQFLTDTTRAGVHLALPQLSQRGSEGLVGGSSFMGGSFAGQGAGGMNGGGMRGGGMQGGGRNNLMDVGSGLLQSLGDSTDGALGTTLHTLSSLTNSRSGYALSTAGTGVDFHVSGSMGNMMGGSAQTGNGQGGRGLGAVPTAHGSGPSLSLKLKF